MKMSTNYSFLSQNEDVSFFECVIGMQITMWNLSYMKQLGAKPPKQLMGFGRPHLIAQEDDRGRLSERTEGREEGLDNILQVDDISGKDEIERGFKGLDLVKVSPVKLSNFHLSSKGRGHTWGFQGSRRSDIVFDILPESRQDRGDVGEDSVKAEQGKP